MANCLMGKAAQFAVLCHGDQMYGSRPYEVHLFDVVHVLRRFFDWEQLPQDFVDAAWLHDVIEDTSVTRHVLDDMFGHRVADLVHAVSNEPGANRKERHAKTYPKIRDTENAITIKLADRVANIEQTVSHDRFGRPPQKLFSMYAREWDDFRDELKGRCKGEGPVEAMMWDYVAEMIDEGNRKLEKLNDMKVFRGVGDR